MSKTVKFNGAKQAAPTKEEMEAQAKRAFYQKRNSLAEGILYNALHSAVGSKITADGNPDFTAAVDAAIQAADRFMERAYAVSITTEEQK